MTPTGLPVHLMVLPSNDHVSSAQLTFTKSSFVMARQPASVPVISARVTGLPGLASESGCAWPSVIVANRDRVMVRVIFILS